MWVGRSSERKGHQSNLAGGVSSNKAGYMASLVMCGWAGAVKTNACKHMSRVDDAKNKLSQTPESIVLLIIRTDGQTNKAGY